MYGLVSNGFCVLYTKFFLEFYSYNYDSEQKHPAWSSQIVVGWLATSSSFVLDQCL